MYFTVNGSVSLVYFMKALTVVVHRKFLNFTYQYTKTLVDVSVICQAKPTEFSYGLQSRKSCRPLLLEVPNSLHDLEEFGL